MTNQPQATISDLVPLMYRARWASFALSGEVRTSESRAGSGAGSGTWEERGSLEVALDGRFRAEIVDANGDRDLLVGDVCDDPVPFHDLMRPSLLLPEFDLRVTGRAEFLGRDAIAIAGSRRWPLPRLDEQVSGLVDTELGILLRYRRASRRRDDSAEFTRLTVGPSESASGEPPPQEAPAFTDAEVNLLYRSDLGPQRFAADLSEQADTETMTRLARESFAATKFGNRTRWLWRPSDDDILDNVDRVTRLAVAMPGRYLIEAITDPGRRPARVACDGERLWRVYPDRVAVRAAEPPPLGIAAIIDPAWLLRERHQVRVVGDAVVDGRPALHVMMAGDMLPVRLGTWPNSPVLVDQAEVFIDRELGICLRQLGSYKEHPVLRIELTSLTTEVDQSLFDYEPPQGTKVITGGMFAEAGQSPAYVALQAGKGVAALALEAGRRWLSRNDVADSQRASPDGGQSPGNSSSRPD